MQAQIDDMNEEAQLREKVWSEQKQALEDELAKLKNDNSELKSEAVAMQTQIDKLKEVAQQKEQIEK